MKISFFEIANTMLLSVIFLFIATTLAVPQAQFDEAFPEENDGLFEGDIELMPGQDPRNRNAQRNRNYRWPRGEIPYVIDTNHFSATEQKDIHDAINMLQTKTMVKGKNCLTFKPRTTETAYIRYQGGSGCHTPVGYHGRLSAVTLGRGCLRIGTIMHETMHALGFWHEQSRPDRDTYVTIEWNNIQSGHARNFDKYTTSQVDTLSLQYDYESVMHYNAYSFAIDRSKPTILVKQRGAVIGQRTHLSPFDVEEIQIYYGCLAPVHGLQSTPAPPTQDPHIAAETCTFQSGMCGWMNMGGDQTNWISRSGNTPTSATGPSADHSGSASGKYLYLEATNHPNQKAYLMSKSYPAGYYCLGIYYHMYGHDEGSLRVELVTGHTRRIIHTVSGDQGNVWHHYLLNVHVTGGTFNFEIEGDLKGDKGDIAIDDLAVHPGRCTASMG